MPTGQQLFNTASGVNLCRHRQTRHIKCSECLEQTGCTYIMQWNTAQTFSSKRI